MTCLHSKSTESAALKSMMKHTKEIWIRPTNLLLSEPLFILKCCFEPCHSGSQNAMAAHPFKHRSSHSSFSILWIPAIAIERSVYVTPKMSFGDNGRYQDECALSMHTRALYVFNTYHMTSISRPRTSTSFPKNMGLIYELNIRVKEYDHVLRVQTR